MSEQDDSGAAPLERLASGVPGIDTILRGGFFRGGVYMILAPPGSGKTILGNQICFQQVAARGRALYVTLLTESHSRLIASLQLLDFFDPAAIGTTLSYVTGYQALEKEGLKGLLSLLRQMIRDHKATFLVIDGFITAGSMAESELETKKFIHELQVLVELVGCTTLLLTGATHTGEEYALRTMVDGLIELRYASVGMEVARTIEVTKFRGSSTLMGRHLFEIGDAGLTIYPRLESLADQKEPAVSRPRPRAAFGPKGLDAMLDGGLGAGSATMLLGAPGSGKTLLGLSFLAEGARRGERGLYFGFFEPPSDLRRKGDAIGLGLSELGGQGLVQLSWQSPTEVIADALAAKLLAAVRKDGMKRLFIDGLRGFKDALVFDERSRRFFGALCNELRALGVVTVISDETRTMSELEVPEHGVTAMLDAVVYLRHVEMRAQLHKLVAVMKMREGAGDPSLREFSIGANGFVVAPDSGTAERILTGHHPVPATKPRARAASAKTKPPKKKSRARRQR